MELLKHAVVFIPAEAEPKFTETLPECFDLVDYIGIFDHHIMNQ